MSAPTPGQAHDPRTCEGCQAMVKRGGHRIIDLLGHGGYLAYGAQEPWREVRERWAQAANAITGAWDGHWGPLDTFDTWMGARGREEGDGHAYGWDDMVAAFAAGAQVTAAAPAGQLPPPRALRDALEAQIRLWRHEAEPDTDDDGDDRAGRDAIGVCAIELAVILARHAQEPQP